MHDFIIFTVPLLIVMYLTYGRLRRRIKSLEAEISAQRQIYLKLREADRDLQAELRRIESRLESEAPQRDSSVQAAGWREPEAEEPPLSRDAPAIPPPLPACDAGVSDEPAPAPAWESARLSEIPEEVAPSLFSRIPWREILGSMHLLPPGKSESGETAESQLAAWWVTRIGLVLLIIAAVFFGIYVSRHTPAWLRVLTLGLVSLGTIGLGARMRGKLEGFGRAIIGGGFALLYFTAFAAFALPATKIIDSPAVGAMAQFSALVVAIVWSLWKRDQTVATLTLFLGLISCGFSHSHDLDRFATVGLVLLAGTGSFLFATRGWLIPFITSLAGSWIGFGVFAVHDWLRADVPTFPLLMVTLAGLTSVFEAGNLACAARVPHAPGGRLRRWLILGNTSAAALLGYGVIRLAHSDRLSAFYFTLSVLFFAFTAIHHLRTTDRAVTESLFLKSSALLCLGFAAAFSGPLRWLAIAFQAFALLWTARRGGSRWIAVGFVVVLAASIGWFWRDLAMEAPAEWRWLDAVRIAGGLYLVFLTLQLGFHSLWFPDGIGGTGGDHRNQARVFRLIGSLVIGISAIALALSPLRPDRSDPAWCMFLLSAVIALPAPIMRKALPCIAAALPLGFSYLAYASLPPGTSESPAALALGITLIIAAFGVSETIRRFWPGALGGASVVRECVLLAGLATLLPFSIALGRLLALSGNAAIGIFALFPAITCAAVMCRQQTTRGGKRPRLSIGFQAAAGVIILTGGAVTCADSGFFPSALAFAGLPLLTMARRVRVWHVVIAGALPILGGFFSLWQRLLDTRQAGLTHDSINLAVLLAISTGIAILLWMGVRSRRLRKASVWGDALLHALGIFSLHWFFQKHLGEGPDFLAAALLGSLLFAVSRRFPFRILGTASWLPILLACLSSILAENWHGDGSGKASFVAAGMLILGQLVASSHSSRNESPEGAKRLPEIISCIAVLAWTLIALATAESPWRAAALAGVALLCSALWRWRSVPRIGHLGLAPIALAFTTAASVMAENTAAIPTSWTLASVLLTAAGFAANGIIMAGAVRRMPGRRITSASKLPWFHAVGALVIAFVACAIDRLVSENLTAVFWGLSAILLFVSGLFAGLRAYRLTGLIGLVFCTGHIFIWDIQDTFYRIIAFFVIGLVMLVIGFLYHRFRERISALDS